MKEALQKIKDEMMRPIYEKRRHLGCEICENSFYGYYEPKSRHRFHAVPNGKTSPHPTKKGWLTVHTHDDVFYPECPDCGMDSFVNDYKQAKINIEHEKEQKRKNKAAAEKRKATIERKRKAYWDRVRHVRANPNDITMEELKNYGFIEALVGRPYYGSRDKETFWDQNGGKNGKYVVQFHSHYKGHSRSGKTHYYNRWFDIEDTETGEKFHVSHRG